MKGWKRRDREHGGVVSARLLELLAKAILAPSRYHKAGFEKLSLMAQENDPLRAKKFIANFLVNFIVLGRGIRDREEKSRCLHLPNFMVISPTMTTTS